MSYTNIDTINILWQFIDVADHYIDNGLVKEVGSGAVLAAMGTHYELNAYYNVTMANGYSFLIRNIDVKQDNHTDRNRCYTTADKSIIEIWVNNDFDYLGAGVSKHTEFGSVIKIEKENNVKTTN